MVFLPIFCDCESNNTSNPSNLSNLGCINFTTYFYLYARVPMSLRVGVFLLWSFSKKFLILNQSES